MDVNGQPHGDYGTDAERITVNPTRSMLESLLRDAGFLEEGEDALGTTKALAELLDDLANHLAICEPDAWWSASVLRDAADELRAQADDAEYEPFPPVAY